jgi:5,10-methylenetetrahydromethanopterin reductase
MDFGIALAPAAESWKTVQRAEQLGFSHAWLYDTQLLCADVFVALALAAANTRRITIGPGVLVPSNRIAPVAANGLASLNKLAPGRIVLGIGTGFTARLTMGQGPIKLSALREYLRVVRGMLRGETVEWLDEHAVPHKVRFLNPEAGLIDIDAPIPVHLSAFAPKARALAARECEGWMNFVTVVPMALYELEEMTASCAAAGRAPETLYKTGFTLGCVLRPGEDAGSPRARAQAGPLAVVLFHGVIEGTIKGTILPAELQAAAEEYRRLYETFDPPDARYLRLHTGHLMFVRPEEERFLSEELIRLSTFTAGRDELVDRVRMLRDAGYQQLAVQLVPGHEDAMADWMEVFSRV